MSKAGWNARAQESILVLGGGFGGLAAALALHDGTRSITVIERDDEPPEIAANQAFAHWKRAGAPQLRHTHLFLARLQMILRRHHPELLAELARVGVLPGALEQSLPESFAGRWQSRPGDEDLVHIWGRRATLEYVLRRYVARTTQVKFLHRTSLDELLIEEVGDQLRVTGARVRGPDGLQCLSADVVIDCTGVHSKSLVSLNVRGANIATERKLSQCAYYCRHFEQVRSDPEPPRRGTGASLDYLVYGVFFAERNTFSVAITCPEFETELLEELRRPEAFDRICQQIPALRRWHVRARATSRVLGGAGLQNRWHHFSRGAAKDVLGFFALGDAYVQTNPIYGRGCSSAFVQAHVLREVLAHTRDARTRARRYHRGVWRAMRQHFEFCLGADAAFIARARLVRGERVSAVERLGSRLYESAFLPAIEQSPFVAREWIKTQQMCQVTPRWVGLGVLLYVALLWLVRTLSGKQRAYEVAPAGPEREDMLAACFGSVASSDSNSTREPSSGSLSVQ